MVATRRALRRTARAHAAELSAPEAPTPERPDSRPDVRPASARAEAVSARQRATERAAAIREHLGDLDEGTDEFFIDKRIMPDGWEYEWKRHTVLGEEEPSYQVALARMGWEPVPASRHPSFMPEGSGSRIIERKGMVLMERPKEINDEVRARDYRRARNQVRQKEEQINSAPQGQFDRDNKGDPLVRVRKAYEPIPVPEN